MTEPFVTAVLSLGQAVAAIGTHGQPKIELPSLRAGEVFFREVCAAVGVSFDAMWPIPYRPYPGLPADHHHVVFAGVLVHFPSHNLSERPPSYDDAIEKIGRSLRIAHEAALAGSIKPGGLKDHQAAAAIGSPPLPTRK